MTDRCYEVAGARVLAPAPPGPEVAAAITALVRAVEESEERRRLALTPEERAAEDARFEAGQRRIRERNARLLRGDQVHDPSP